MLRIIAVCYIVLIPGACFAQNIKGKVFDGISVAPIEYANIYFANTTIGATSNADGQFVLKVPELGRYTLMASFIGYKTFSVEIEILTKETFEVNIPLIPDVRQLPEIFVNADTSDWEENYRIFFDHFIGITKASKSCAIKNKKALNFYFDPYDRTLYGHAREPLIIFNDYLGYKITYELISFKLEYKQSKLEYFGIPRFELMIPKSRNEENKWSKRREEVYRGSIYHFFKSLYHDQLSGNEFKVQEFFRVPNQDRLPEELIRKKLDQFMKDRPKLTTSGNKTIIRTNDSLDYYLQERNKPKYLDSLGVDIINKNQVAIGDSLFYKGNLKITYLGAKESSDYPNLRRPPYREYQNTVMNILSSLKLYPNGYYDYSSTFVQGYWGWTGAVGNILPLDYEPKKQL
jgi:hypothetical protein